MKSQLKSIPAIALLVAALATSCSSPQTPQRQVLRAGTPAAPTRVACVGDSITYGSGIVGRETNSYPAVLDRLLGEQYEVRNFGVGGATLLKQGDKPYWTQAAYLEVGAFAPQAIIIKLGTNDSKPQNWRHKGDFASDLEAMIDTFRRLPSHPQIWLCLPVPVYETRWGINEATVRGEIIPLIEKVADDKDVPVIDLYDALSDHPEMFSDKIHPNATGAKFMAEVVAAAVAGK